MCGFGRQSLETVTSLLVDVRGSLWSWYWILFVRLLSVHKQQRITDSRASVLHDHTAVVSQICVSLTVCVSSSACVHVLLWVSSNFSKLKRWFTQILKFCHHLLNPMLTTIKVVHTTFCTREVVLEIILLYFLLYSCMRLFRFIHLTVLSVVGRKKTINLIFIRWHYLHFKL